MSKRTIPDMKELFKEAAEIAQAVPESMQEAAFNRALDLLTSSTSSVSQNDTARKQSKRNPPLAKKEKKATEEVDDEANLICAINSTQHPGVRAASKILDRALMVLQIAMDDHGIDGLPPSTISQILTDKFRIKTTASAVSMALGRVTDLVDRQPQGNGFIYRIMGPGIDHLAHLGESPKQPPPKKTKNKSITQQKEKKKKTKVSPKKKSGARPGPGAMVKQLAAEGFFKKPKAIQDIINYCQAEMAYSYKSTDLSVTMTRALRNKLLKRQKNADNQYEYYSE